MAYDIPTTEELYQGHKTRLESQIGQDAPSNEKAFIKVLAKTEAALDIGQYKKSADDAKQNFAIAATGNGLDRIGNDNSTPRKQAVTAVLEVELDATTGVVILANTEFSSESNNLRYKTTADATSVAGVATLNLRCLDSGADGNLDNGEELTITAQIAGADTRNFCTARSYRWR
jgi:uncharacterized phage protein gp47/JayE